MTPTVGTLPLEPYRADLVAQGERVYAVRLLASTLEDAYLEAVGEEVRG